MQTDHPEGSARWRRCTKEAEIPDGQNQHLQGRRSPPSFQIAVKDIPTKLALAVHGSYKSDLIEAFSRSPRADGNIWP